MSDWDERCFEICSLAGLVCGMQGVAFPSNEGVAVGVVRGGREWGGLRRGRRWNGEDVSTLKEVEMASSSGRRSAQEKAVAF